MKRFVPWIMLVVIASWIGASWFPPRTAKDNVDLAKLQHRIGPSLADGIVTTLSQAVEHLAPIASPENSETSPRTAVPEQPTALEPTHHG